MSDHTPGPWTYNGTAFYDSDNNEVVGVNVSMYDDGEEDADIKVSASDARLIAAAPDLLHALKDLLGEGPDIYVTEKGEVCIGCGRDYSDDEAWDEAYCMSDDCLRTMARAAIAKAEGQSVKA